MRPGIALKILLYSAVMTANCVLVTSSAFSQRNVQAAVKSLRLPEGFHIEVWADQVTGARSLALSPGGTVFVGTRDVGNVYAIPISSRKVTTVASGLHMPNGVAVKNGSLYVAEIHRVLRFADIEHSFANKPSYTVVNQSFPEDEAHGWKFIAFGPDGKLYVPIGMPCNICEKEDKRYGTIMRMNPDGSDLKMFAHGIRNSVGFDWQPGSKMLWFTDNGRDMLGDDLPPDELNRAPVQGMNFGFPYCYGKNINNPEFSTVDCSHFTPSALDLGAHVASLGMRFYTGSMFPEHYRGGIFIAEHGSWNRTVPIGYRVVYVPVHDSLPGPYEIFAEGWLEGSTAWGRPVDVLVLPDGSLLVSDDRAGVIYRIFH